MLRIEQGKVTKERLYLIQFQDDDFEHFTAEQVEAFRVHSDGEDEEKDEEGEARNEYVEGGSLELSEQCEAGCADDCDSKSM